MSFKIGNLPLNTSYSTAFNNVGTINNAAKNAIERAKLYKEGMKDIYDTYPMTDPNVRSSGFLGDLGSVVKGAAGAGLFNNMFSNLGGGFGNQFSGRGSSGTDAWGRDFDDPWATANNTGLIIDPFGTDNVYGGTTTEWNTDMNIPSSGGKAWYNPFGWGR